ncbi:hypothetical protein KHQ81_08285 [Mycoplasmatota bacterium]|nr:hypothetical protein KHQ81_08285 [Mycoplasmatota bacterium]
MNQVPIKLDEADVLYFTGNKKANHFGYVHYDDHKENITALVISTCGHNDYYLFSCDINWNVISDTLHHSVEEAMDCASISHHFNNIWYCKSGGLVFKSDNNVIELFYEYTYSLNSNDNHINYSQIYKSDDYNSHCSKYGLKLSQKNKIIKSILLMAGSFDAPVNTDNVIIDGKRLLISVCDTLFCLNTLNLSLVWKVKVDDSICFISILLINFILPMVKW